MRKILFASAAAAALIVATGAQAQTAGAPASNIDTADTHSQIAPRLPTPAVGGDAGPRDYLRTAERALDMHRTGEAQEALERAESRALDRASDSSIASTPDQDAMIQQVSTAREQLGHGDLTGARRSIDQALSVTTAAATPVAAPRAASTLVPSAAAAAAPASDTASVASGAGYVGPDGTDDAPGNFGQGTIPGTTKPLDDLGPTNTGEAASSGQN